MQPAMGNVGRPSSGTTRATERGMDLGLGFVSAERVCGVWIGEGSMIYLSLASFVCSLVWVLFLWNRIDEFFELLTVLRTDDDYSDAFFSVKPSDGLLAQLLKTYKAVGRIKNVLLSKRVQCRHAPILANGRNERERPQKQ